MTDDFKADLWSIQPYIQVSGVGENDTIIVEKAWGARIELAKFTDMSAVKAGYIRRLGGVSAGLTISPDLAAWMARNFRRAKYRQVYPRLFSFEGFMSLDEIEEKLFGAPVGLLLWSTNASTLSKHEPGNPVYEPKTELSGDGNKTFAGLHLSDSIQLQADIDIEAQNGIVPNSGAPDEQSSNGRDSIEAGDGRIETYPIIGRQPWTACNCSPRGNDECSCPDMTDRRLRKMGRSAMGEDKVRNARNTFAPFNCRCRATSNMIILKIFTLIDTATMTVTLLKAAWPPQALIACGTEGGMERVLACSYDWTTGVLYKESVLRLPGTVLESMHKLPRIRLGLKKTLESVDIAPKPESQPVEHRRPVMSMI